jgi:hypothetical protein
MTDDVKKDRFLDNEPANELSRQLTDLRFKHSKVNLDKVDHDPDLSRLADTINKSREKRPKSARISRNLLNKLAGLDKAKKK